ncbi:hypothetical protein AXG93_4368s2220 [Marchantia polymorpha subsp. ruderalis]|uniref:Uncharacterized protein n=1 Tax=Marchantia polymorpha subsp. ruderalis TaxID=1480154 RepID=A0A176VZW3_MARPO|nr:hypothetical protein AXG93_4368s2220 [Marchantia polymorpha subsp. ruderalis]
MKKLLHAADSRVEVSSRMGSVGLWLMLLVETPGPVKEFALGERREYATRLILILDSTGKAAESNQFGDQLATVD